MGSILQQNIDVVNLWKNERWLRLTMIYIQWSIVKHWYWHSEHSIITFSIVKWWTPGHTYQSFISTASVQCLPGINGLSPTAIVRLYDSHKYTLLGGLRVVCILMLMMHLHTRWHDNLFQTSTTCLNSLKMTDIIVKVLTQFEEKFSLSLLLTGIWT